MYWGNYVSAHTCMMMRWEDRQCIKSASQTPTPGNPDNSEYNTLWGGLRVSSAYFPSMPGVFLPTTTGVLVNGNEFVSRTSDVIGLDKKN